MTRQPLTILSVEDEAINQLLVSATIARADAPLLREGTIVTAKSLEEARRAIVDTRYDLVLLDRRLPDGDGFDLARELNRHPSRPYILALTADAVPATRSAASAAGCDAILTKPFRPAEFLAVISDLLELDVSAGAGRKTQLRSESSSVPHRGRPRWARAELHDRDNVRRRGGGWGRSKSDRGTER